MARTIVIVFALLANGCKLATHLELSFEHHEAGGQVARVAYKIDGTEITLR